MHWTVAIAHLQVASTLTVLQSIICSHIQQMMQLPMKICKQQQRPRHSYIAGYPVM